MDVTTGIVVIFGMLFLVLAVGILSHHYLEQGRIKNGYYWSAPKPEPTKDADGYDIIHVTDLYSIGGDFNVMNNGRTIKHGLVMGMPTRDTLAVKWLDVTKEEPVQS
jgi:hypothetical protein